MANVRFMFRDYISLANVYSDISSNEVSTLPASNLKVNGRTKVFRTIGVADGTFTVKCELGSEDVAISDLYLLQTNFTTNAQITVTMWDSTLAQVHNATYPALPAGATNFVTTSKNTHIKFPSTIIANSITLAVNDSSNTDGYLQASRLLVGESFSTKINAQYGLNLYFEEDTTQKRSMGGSLYSDNSKSYRGVDMRLPELTKDEVVKLLEAAEYVGKRKDFVVSIYPEDSDPYLDQISTFGCKFKSMPKFEQFSYDRWRATFNIVEA